MNYTDITQSFGEIYNPTTALLVYQSETTDKKIYVEAYDINSNGVPVNAHPLTMTECNALAEALRSSEQNTCSYLIPEGLLPANVLYLNPASDGFAIWITPAMNTDIFFTKDLDIPSGRANMPALLWKASKEELFIYALKTVQSVTEKTMLYQAPFFNIHNTGRVCMGSVNINIEDDCTLEQFMQAWQEYFFHSRFSHLIESNSPVTGNIVQLWQSLVNTDKKFPANTLRKNNLTIKNLLP